MTADFFVSPQGNDAWSGTAATSDGQGNGPFLYSSPAVHLYPSWRNSNGPAARNGGIGFRCARTP